MEDRRLIRVKSRVAGWGVAGLVVALVLIAGSVAALDRHILGHDDWARDDDRGVGVVVLATDRPGANQPGGSGRAEGQAPAAIRRAQRETGGTVAPEPRRGDVRSGRRREEAAPALEESSDTVRVRAPLEPAPPAVVRTLPEDADGDGLTDRLEADLGTDPRNEDSDGDALPDGWEEQYRLDPTSAGDAEADVDGDGLLNTTEYRVKSNPRALDTNHDGTPDGADDADGDALPNGVEQALPGADPSNPDTNGDGQGDGADDEDGDGLANVEEVAGGTDPGVPDAPPVEEPPAEPPVPAEEPAAPPVEEPAAPEAPPAAEPAAPDAASVEPSAAPSPEPEGLVRAAP